MHGVCVFSEGGHGRYLRGGGADGDWVSGEFYAIVLCLSVKLLTFVYLYKVGLIDTDTIIVQSIRNSFK